MSDTVLDRILARLASALEYNANATVAPVALLWPDEGSQWQSIIERVGDRLPIVRMGEYDPHLRQGPAYWVRCVVARAIDVIVPSGMPIVYLPGVARGSLRAVDACPSELAPIAELQYRSQWFSHPNGKDWTVRSLLSHVDKGLGLRVEEDGETTAVMLLALDQLLDERVERLAKQVLDADFFSDLINPDPVNTLLGWLDDPSGFRPRLDAARWSAFVQQCKNDYGFDPASDGEITAARRLAERQGPWANAWKRFAEQPELYSGIAARLRQAKPMEQLFPLHREVWPQDNEDGEDQLRKALRDFEALTAQGARKEAAKLNEEHAWRRATVWAELDQAPLSFAIEQLALLASVAAQPLTSSNLASLTKDYAGRGWHADDALVRALATVRSPADREAVSAAGVAIYRPWLEAAATALQSMIGPMANSGTYLPGAPASSKAGSIAVFVDGLRLDIAHRVAGRLTASGFDVDLATSLAALPTVTQTSKPALMPLKAGALGSGPDLNPANAVTGTKATIQVWRSLMDENSVQVLGPTEIGNPSGSAWTEAGDVDHRGHDVGIRLVEELDDMVGRIVVRIRELLDGGWTTVTIVTDHGWILLPDGMEKVELPVATAEYKKGRCARLKDGAKVDVPTVPWFWDRDVRIALAPGATCFEANKQYEHGGVSPQECIVPRITVSAGRVVTPAHATEITKVKWLGLLCRIEFTGTTRGVMVDLRALPADARTSIAEQAKETNTAGKVSLVVPDEDHEGESVHLVLVAADGSILAQREVVVGQNR